MGVLTGGGPAGAPRAGKIDAGPGRRATLPSVNAPRKYAALAIAVSWLGACVPRSPPVTLPEARVRVVDASGEPVAGIAVWYAVQLEVYRRPLLGFIPHIDGLIGRRLEGKLAARTDAAGEVVLPARVVAPGRSEHFTGEVLFVNTAVDLESQDARLWLEFGRRECAEGGPLCTEGGAPGAIDVAEGLWLDADHGRALWPERAGYPAVHVLVVKPDEVSSYPPWGDDRFVLRGLASARAAPETFTVRLEGAKPAARPAAAP